MRFKSVFQTKNVFILNLLINFLDKEEGVFTKKLSENRRKVNALFKLFVAELRSQTV